MATKTDTDKYALAIANRAIEPISVGLNINVSIKPKNRIFFKHNSFINLPFFLFY